MEELQGPFLQFFHNNADPSMVPRALEPQLLTLPGQFPVVGLLGPRQVGKTSLALEVTRQASQPTHYLDLESSRDRLLLRDTDAFFNATAGQLVVLDEVQRMPALFAELRGHVDARRRAGHRVGFRR